MKTTGIHGAPLGQGNGQHTGLAVTELEHIARLQRDILERMALSDNIHEVLDALCLLAEKLVDDAVASIMLMDEEKGWLNIIAGPSLPPGGKAAFSQLTPSPHNGSCANVLYQGEPTFVCDIDSDPRWNNVRHLARDAGIRACWSVPVRTAGNKITGTFALSSTTRRKPDAFQIQLLETCAYVAGIAFLRQHHTRELEHMAWHDPLTDLPNRKALTRAIDGLLESTAPSTQATVLFIDLDRFKNINDTHGHQVGDEVLKEVAGRLLASMTETMTLARIGGDEFVVIIKDEPQTGRIEQIAKNLLAIFATPYMVQGAPFYLMASIGIARYPQDGQHARALLSNADAAMYRAKQAGRNQFRFYSPELTERARSELTLEQELRNALDTGQFELYYQPQVCARDGTVLCAEALLRWHHPQRGLVPPMEFIPFAEDIGLISDIGTWVARQACQQLELWHADGQHTLKMAINVSGRQLEPDALAALINIVNAFGLPPERLELELTESYLMQHAQGVLEALGELRQTGVGLVIDDFGEGYSSLAHLKRFPVNSLKIDQSLVAGLSSGKHDLAISQAIIALGHAMGFKVVAEGVETAEQQTLLASAGCDILQGYHFGRPVSADDFATRLSAH